MPRGADVLLDSRLSSSLPSHQLKVLSCHRWTAHSKLTQTGLFSAAQAQRQRGSQDCTWGHSWHQISAKTTVVSFALVTQWHPRWARDRGGEAENTVRDTHRSLQKWQHVWIGTHKWNEGLGTMTVKPHTQKQPQLTSSDCLAQTRQQLEALQSWDLTCNKNNN